MKSRRRSRLNSWLLPALAVGMVAAWRINRPAVALSDATLAAFEADLETAMQTFQMPGAAIVYAWGFGLRDPHSKPTVSPHTQFRIASSTERASTARSRRGGLETRMRPGRY
jgi:CubicO group peptidase (beta-lactamase class C family)